MDGSRFATRPFSHSSGSGMVMSLNSFPLLRDSHMASKPLFTTCGRRAGRRRGDGGARVSERRLFGPIALARLSRGRRPRGGDGGRRSDRSAGGRAYLFADERAGDDDGDVHARALREGVEAGNEAVAVRLGRGRAGVFGRWSRARSVEARLRIRRSRRGTHRHRGLVERFEHGIRGLFSKEAFARFGLCLLATRARHGSNLSLFAVCPSRKNLPASVRVFADTLRCIVHEHLVYHHWYDIAFNIDVREWALFPICGRLLWSSLRAQARVHRRGKALTSRCPRRGQPQTWPQRYPR